MEENMSQSDDQGRPQSPAAGTGGAQPYGSQPTQQFGQQQFGHPTYGNQQYGDQRYGQSPYAQQPYPAPGGYGVQYGQQPAPGQQFGPAPAYGQYGTGRPAKPGTVVTAAVLGFVFGALGVIATLLTIVAGAALSSIFGTESGDEELATGIFGFVLVIAVLIAVWTAITVWGSVWALTGRSRVLLIVAGSIAVAVTLFAFLASLSDSTAGAGGVLWSVLILGAAVALVVLLSVRQSADFFAAHRAARGR
jgi:hypothetical protein